MAWRRRARKNPDTIWKSRRKEGTHNLLYTPQEVSIEADQRIRGGKADTWTTTLRAQVQGAEKTDLTFLVHDNVIEPPKKTGIRELSLFATEM